MSLPEAYFLDAIKEVTVFGMPPSRFSKGSSCGPVDHCPGDQALPTFHVVCGY
jgi:hypothetical protein